MAGPDIPRRGDMRGEEAMAKISEAQSLGLRSVKFTGGEPFVHPDLLDIIEFCGSQGIAMGIETNATLIDADAAAMLARHRVYIAISIDNPDRRVHDAFRHMESAFDKAMRGLEHLANAGCRTQITASINADSSDPRSLRGLVDLAASSGAEKLKLNIIVAVGRAAQCGNLLSVEEAIAVNEFVEKEIIPSAPVKVVTSLPVAFKSTRAIRQTVDHLSCDVKHMIGLLPDGRWSLCGFAVSAPHLIMGGADAPLREIWEEAWQLTELRETELGAVAGVCTQCVMNTVCRGHCPAATFAANGTFRAPYPFCQSAYEAGKFPPTRLIPTARGRQQDANSRHRAGEFPAAYTLDEAVTLGGSQ